MYIHISWSNILINHHNNVQSSKHIHISYSKTWIIPFMVLMLSSIEHCNGSNNKAQHTFRRHICCHERHP